MKIRLFQSLRSKLLLHVTLVSLPMGCFSVFIVLQSQPERVVLVAVVSGALLVFAVLISLLFAHVQIVRPLMVSRDRILKENQTRAGVENELRLREKQLQEQKENLEQAKNEAIEASRVKSEFLSTMSHEIRTPLNAIVGMADVLADELKDQELHEYILVLKKNASHLLDLINDLLDLSKIEAGRMTLENEVFDIHAMLGHVVELMKLKTEQKGLELKSRMDNRIPKLMRGDEVRLRQILLNLIGNAVKFTAKGAVMMEVEPDPDWKGKSSKCGLQIRVRDTGIGVSQDKLDVIFDSFTQADASTTRKYGGTGLGLAITKKMVEAMGGTITVQSEVDKGSEFLIKLQLEVVKENESQEEAA